MEDFKIALGVELKSDALKGINAQIKSLHAKPIKLQIDTNGVKDKLKTIEKQIKGLNDIQVTLNSAIAGSKGGNKNPLPISPVDVTSLTQSLDKLNASLVLIQNSLGSLDKASGMQSILTTINQVNSSLSEMSKQFKSVEQMFNGTSFNLNFNLGLGGSKNPVANNALFSDKAKTEIIPQLQRQADELAHAVSKIYKGSNDYGAAMALIYQAKSQLSDKTDPITLDNIIRDPEGSLSSRISALKQFINILQEAAAIKGIDLSSVTSGFSKTADELVRDSQKVLSGERQMEESMQKLKTIFGSGSQINLDGVSEQITAIINKLDELNRSIQQLSTNNSFSGLTEQFKGLSASISQIADNCAIIRNSLVGGLSGAGAAAQNASNEINNAGAAAQNVASGLNNAGAAAQNVAGNLNSVGDAAQNASNSINGINGIALTATADQIENMKAAMSSFGFDSSSITAATSEIEKMHLTVSKITTTMNADGSIKLTITGIDEAGRAVTAVRAVRKEIDDLGVATTKIDNLGTTISQSFGVSKDVVGKYNELLNVIKEMGSISAQLTLLDGNKDASKIADLQKMLLELNDAYDSIMVKFGKSFDTAGFTNGITQAWTNAENAVASAEAKMADARANIARDIKVDLNAATFDKEVTALETKLNSLTSSTDSVKQGLSSVRAALDEMRNAARAGDTEALIAAHDKYVAALKTTSNEVDILTKKQKEAADTAKLGAERQTLSTKMSAWLKQNSAAAGQFGEEIRKLQAELDNCDARRLSEIKREFERIKNEAILAGKNTKTFGHSLKDSFKKLSIYFSAYRMISYATRALRSMFNNVVAIDTAMTELKKVTEETDASYRLFLTNAEKRAQEIGTTIDGLVTSTAGFARLGYDFNEAQELAEIANIYAVVGDEIDDVEEATKNLISTMTAFGDEVTAMEIIDKFNEVSNRFAISAGGIGEALTRSASSMAAAGNTLDETIALITAANTVVQDPDSVGKFCRL